MFIKRVKNRLLMYRNLFVKVIVNIKNPILFIIKKGKMGINKDESRNVKVIVSLTSYPERMKLGKLHKCLKSLLLQNYRPDKIILYLGKEEFTNYSIPNEVNELKKYGLEICFVEDLKPHTKYFYSLQEYNDACVVTVDDDCYYSPNLLSDLVKAHEEYPKSIICTRGHFIKFQNKEILPYNNWEHEAKEFNYESHFILATGVGGVLYPPNALPKEAFDKNKLTKLALRQDDLWLKIMEIIGNVKVVAIPSYKTKYVVGILGSERVNLFSGNVINNENDSCIFNLLLNYHIKYEDFEK